jgi:site-specific DNA recombinase
MIRRETLESDFEAIARGLVPAPEICSAAQAILSDAWDRRAALQQQRRKSLQARVAEIDTETGKLLKKIIEVESRTVISTLEKRIDALEAEKLTIGEKMEQSGKPLKPFGQVFRTSMAFLENPFRLWACGRYEDRRILLKFAFAEKLAYKRGEGFQTPKKSSLFNILEENLGGLKRLAERRRFELLCGLSPTIRFRVGAVMTASVPLRSTAIIAASACFRSS